MLSMPQTLLLLGSLITSTNFLQTEPIDGGAVFGEANSEGCGRGKLLSPERRRGAVRHARESYQVSERPACRLLGQWRGTQRYEVIYRIDEDALTRDIVTLASEYGRYGYRRITALLRNRGWPVGKDRVQRIWRREGLKVPQRQRPRGRLWLGVLVGRFVGFVGWWVFVNWIVDASIL